MLRKCKHCGLIAHTKDDLELFCKNGPSKYGRQNLCLSCYSSYKSDLYKGQREDILEKRRAHYKVNRDRKLEYQKEYYLNNKPSVYAVQANRRAVKKDASVSWADREVIKKLYNDAAALKELTGIDFHVDHIIPLNHDIVCGLHCENNLQILTAHENMSKGNKFEEDYGT